MKVDEILCLVDIPQAGMPGAPAAQAQERPSNGGIGSCPQARLFPGSCVTPSLTTKGESFENATVECFPSVGIDSAGAPDGNRRPSSGHMRQRHRDVAQRSSSSAAGHLLQRAVLSARRSRAELHRLDFNQCSELRVRVPLGTLESLNRT